MYYIEIDIKMMYLLSCENNVKLNIKNQMLCMYIQMNVKVNLAARFFLV